mmetsp:Transcript_24767/g.65836  ORF Transcript_24767/g.65836 Transcript_24767/m.65836 type:complete len:111 (-) Transcript_24767:31-363(-)
MPKALLFRIMGNRCARQIPHCAFSLFVGSIQRGRFNSSLYDRVDIRGDACPQRKELFGSLVQGQATVPASVYTFRIQFKFLFGKFRFVDMELSPQLAQANGAGPHSLRGG